MTDEEELHPTARAFLDALDLPARHPFLDEDWRDDGRDSGVLNVDKHKWSLLDYFVPAARTESGADRGVPYRGGGADDPAAPGMPIRGVRPARHPLGSFENASPTSFVGDGGGGGGRDGDAYANRSARLPAAAAAAGDLAESAASAASRIHHVARQVLPCMLSTFHLCFLRLFCPLLWASGAAYLMAQPLIEAEEDGPASASGDGEDGRSGGRRRKKRGRRRKIRGHLNLVASLTALISAMTMMTDTMYVLEYTRPPLVALFALTAGLVAVRSHSRRRAAAVILPVAAASAAIWLLCDIDLPTTATAGNGGTLVPGFYYDPTNPIAAAVAEDWDEDKRTYDDGRGTPWLVNGDTRTGVPFLLNKVPAQSFVRRWVPSKVPGETEALILDIALPSDGIHRTDRPMYLILHGLNGGSNEEYVKDFVVRRRSEGSTVAVLVTRGLMDSPVLGDNLPHFARVSDAASAAEALKGAAGPNQTVAGVGYSMGAITLANYVARSGTACRLDAAVALSGALDTRVQLNFRHSTRLWQPFLAKTFRETVTAKFADRLRRRLTDDQILEVERADSVVALDESLFVRYNGFDGILHYYSEMGAMGDWTSFDGADPRGGAGRIADVSVPLLNVHALDDPIGDPRCLRDPKKLSRTGRGYVFVLLTRRGGHVGWPLGARPGREKWRWMSDVASSFVESVDRVRHRKITCAGGTATANDTALW